MFNLTRKEKKEIILEKVAEYEITAYEISKKTGLNVGGIEKILKGLVKNPHESTLNAILEFLESYLVGRNTTKEMHIINEPKTVYNTEEVWKKLYDCMDENKQMVSEISRLKLILERNKIEFEEKF